MITGWVNTSNELIVPLTIRDPAGRDTRIEFVVDTGFSGTLTLPPATIATLGLVWASSLGMVLANGTQLDVEVYEAVVLWNGSPQATWIRAVETAPLIGMGLLAGHDLWARIEDGGNVEIEAIP